MEYVKARDGDTVTAYPIKGHNLPVLRRTLKPGEAIVFEHCSRTLDISRPSATITFLIFGSEPGGCCSIHEDGEIVKHASLEEARGFQRDGEFERLKAALHA